MYSKLSLFTMGSINGNLPSYHMNANYTHLHICLQGEVCAPSPVQAYNAIASCVFTRAVHCELLQAFLAVAPSCYSTLHEAYICYGSSLAPYHTSSLAAASAPATC